MLQLNLVGHEVFDTLISTTQNSGNRSLKMWQVYAGMSFLSSEISAAVSLVQQQIPSNPFNLDGKRFRKSGWQGSATQKRWDFSGEMDQTLFQAASP